MRRIGTYAGIDKPVNAHNFRHYFATIMYRDYDLDRDTIRMLLGHVKGSSALEKTYSHLFDEDYIRKAEEALGYREKEQRSPFTPETCPTCGELLEEHWRRCPACDERFAPGEEDIKDLAKEVREEVTNVALSEDLTPEEREGLRALLTVIDDPAVLARKLAESGN